jgi:trehalose 6-phosphate synthase/phosphatase
VALFLDYDGTLREIEREPGAASPNAAVTQLLNKLAAQPNVDVTIISGRRREDLTAWLGRYPFALVAEHGASVRRAPAAGRNARRLTRATATERERRPRP